MWFDWVCVCVRCEGANACEFTSESQGITENNAKTRIATKQARKAEEMKNNNIRTCRSVGWLCLVVYMRSAHTQPLTLIVNSKVMQILLVLSFDAECKLSVSDDDSSATVAVVVVSLG